MKQWHNFTSDAPNIIKLQEKHNKKEKKENPQVKDEFLKTPKLTKIHKEKVSEILYILKKRLPERDKLKTELNI